MRISETEFEKRLAEATDKDSLAQLAYDVIEASCDNKPRAKLLCSRFEKMLDKGLDINTIVDEQICINGLQYGYTDYHLEVARLIFDRCGLPMAKCDGETFFDWIEGKVLYNYYDCDFVVKLFLLCLSYVDEENELMKMNANLYPEMFDECTMYTSILFVKEPENPLKLNYKVFRDFENIDFCIEMLEQETGYYGCWKMHIFDKKSKLEIAVYGDK